MLKDITAMVAEREALRLGIQRQVECFPTEVGEFDFGWKTLGKLYSTKLMWCLCACATTKLVEIAHALRSCSSYLISGRVLCVIFEFRLSGCSFVNVMASPGDHSSWTPTSICHLPESDGDAAT